MNAKDGLRGTVKTPKSSKEKWSRSKGKSARRKKLKVEGPTRHFEKKIGWDFQRPLKRRCRKSRTPIGAGKKDALVKKKRGDLYDGGNFNKGKDAESREIKP